MHASGHGVALTLAAVIVVVWATLMGLAVTAAKPPSDGGGVVAVFAPGHADAAFAAIIRAGGRPVGRRWGGLVWQVDTDAGGAHRLEAAGAIAVLREFPFVAALGCAPSDGRAQTSSLFHAP